MPNLGYKPAYRRRLPHIQPPGATLFVTFRLAGSIPAQTRRLLLEESARLEVTTRQISDPAERERKSSAQQRRLFGAWDNALHSSGSGPCWLQDERVAKIVSDSILYLDTRRYVLDAFCIMPNHVHLICQPLQKADDTHYSISAIMHSLKRHTALQANQLLGRKGPFWEHENYDHVVRGESELNRIVIYVLYNPVKAGLVLRPQDWRWSYNSSGLEL